MKKFIHLILLFIATFSWAESQPTEWGVIKSSTFGITASDKVENVLYKGEDFIILNAYPNPADSYFVLKYSIPSHITNLKFEVRNVLGNEVYSFSLTPEKSEGIKVSTAHLSPGVYFQILYQGNRNLVSKKLIIKHN